MQIALLGPLEVTVDGCPVAVTGARLRTLLVRLAVGAPRAVSATELLAAIWGEEPPADAANALQSLVSRLRRALGGSSTVLAEPAGYRLPVDADAIDLHRFADQLRRVRQLLDRKEYAEAVDAADRALLLWRGDPLTDAGDAEFAGPVVTSCRNERLDLIGCRHQALIELGRGPELIIDLEQLVAQHPLREQFTAQLIRALAAAGRTSEGLERYERCRSFLAEEFGTDPGVELQQLHLALLRDEVPTGAGRQPERLPTNLSPALTSFVGRDVELERIAAALASSRLTTVVGPGGAGKTRIAAEAARAALERSLTSGGRVGAEAGPVAARIDEAGIDKAGIDEAWLVELAPVGTGANIIGAILTALGLRDPKLIDRTDRPGASVDDTERLVDHLRRRRCLLVLDNCEHLIDAAAKVAEDLLARVPELRILATSREPLAITGEVLCPLPPLELPPPDCPLEDAPSYAAVRLWLDRATAIDAAFVLDPTGWPAVVEIVRRLDGLPLAIELAAARLRALPVADIARLLSDRFRLLTGGSRTSMPRHRTLRAVVEWSWDLLTDAERLLAMRLAIFPAGAGIDTAMSVCADDQLPAEAIGELLITLTDKSWLQRSTSSPVRFRMLETIREYGIERLTEVDGLQQARTRHADHFLALVQELEPAMRDHRQLEARARLELEQENIFAAIRYLLDSERPHDGLLLTLGLLWYFQVQDHEGELIYWIEQCMEALDGTDDPLLDYAQVAAAIAATSVESELGWHDLRERLRTVLPRLRAQPSPPYGSLEAFRIMLPLYLNFSDDPLADAPRAPRIAIGLIDDMLAEADRMADPWPRGIAYMTAAAVAENQGELDTVDRYSDRAYREFQHCGDRWGLSSTLNLRAQVSALRGDNLTAIKLLKESLNMSPLMGAEDDALIIHLRLAGLSMRLGDLPAAREHLAALRGIGHRGNLDLERGMFADAMEVELLWLEDDHGGALQLAADLRAQLSHEERHNRFVGHRVAIAATAIALVEAEAALSAGPQTSAGRDHLCRGFNDLAVGYRPTLTTEDVPLLAEFATSLAMLAAVANQPEKAAFLLGVGSGLIRSENPSDTHRRRVSTIITPRLDAEELARISQTGQDLPRDEAVTALDPVPLIVELGIDDPTAC